MTSDDRWDAEYYRQWRRYIQRYGRPPFWVYEWSIVYSNTEAALKASVKE